MFTQTCVRIREAIYGSMGHSQIDRKTTTFSNGTAFMIAPNYLITAAHAIHIETDRQKPIHSQLEVIRAPDIGQPMETAHFVAEDTSRDIALLKIEAPRSVASVNLLRDKVPIGTSCGSLGFPLAEIIAGKRAFNLLLRFQGASVSAHRFPPKPGLEYYETDSLMYNGSSGCPGFLINGDVWGMQDLSLIESHQHKKSKGMRKNLPPVTSGSRMAISLWVPSWDIIHFAERNGVNI